MQFEYFACVVNGEYAGTLGVAHSMPALIAGMKSEPTIVPITDEQRKNIVLGIKKSTLLNCFIVLKNGNILFVKM